MKKYTYIKYIYNIYIYYIYNYYKHYKNVITYILKNLINIDWPYGVTVSTLDFESINPSSNLGRTSFLFEFFLYGYIFFQYDYN